MKKNIWIINHYASEMYKTGGGRHHWFAKYLTRAGYNPIIICCNVFYMDSEDYIDTASKLYTSKVKDGVKYIFIKSNTYKGNGFGRLKNILSFYHNLLRCGKNISYDILTPDVILASSVHPLTCLAGLKLSKRFNVPCISEIRDLWPEELIQDDGLNENGLIAKALFRLENKIYSESDATIFTLQGGVDYIREKKWDVAHGGNVNLEKVYYINNGVDLESYYDNLKLFHIKDYDLDDDTIFKVVYAGAINKTNGVERLVKIGKLISEYANIKILIWGNGDHLDALKTLIKNEGVKNVIYKGVVEKKYIPYILSKSNINILNYKGNSSFTYGCSNNKLFEFLASGNPIICTVKMNYSIINQYNCGLEIEDNEEIAQEIIRIYKGGAKLHFQLAENAKIAAKDFDFSTHTQKLITIIESL